MGDMVWLDKQRGSYMEKGMIEDIKGRKKIRGEDIETRNQFSAQIVHVTLVVEEIHGALYRRITSQIKTDIRQEN
jgi:hypothetical protein